jgi:hypothetical protein
MSQPTELEYGLDFQGRRRFFGIYSAVVLPGTDPKGRFAVQLQIPGPSGMEKTSWAKACLPITSNSYHPDHLPHTASEIAALLTTQPTSTPDAYGNTDIPALTIVAKPGNGQLNHAHTRTVPPYSTAKSTVVKKSMVNTSLQVVTGFPTTTTDTLENSKYNPDTGHTAPGLTSTDTSITTPEHTFHRTVPQPGQKIWVMFEAGDPEYPVWIGVQA